MSELKPLKGGLVTGDDVNNEFKIGADKNALDQANKAAKANHDKKDMQKLTPEEEAARQLTRSGKVGN